MPCVLSIRDLTLYIDMQTQFSLSRIRSKHNKTITFSHVWERPINVTSPFFRQHGINTSIATDLTQKFKCCHSTKPVIIVKHFRCFCFRRITTSNCISGTISEKSMYLAFNTSYVLVKHLIS